MRNFTDEMKARKRFLAFIYHAFKRFIKIDQNFLNTKNNSAKNILVNLSFLFLCLNGNAPFTTT